MSGAKWKARLTAEQIEAVDKAATGLWTPARLVNIARQWRTGRCLREIATAYGVSHQTISNQISRLRRHGFILEPRKKTTRSRSYNRSSHALTGLPLVDRRALRSIATEAWDDARLHALVIRRRDGEMLWATAAALKCSTSHISLWVKRLREAGVSLPDLTTAPPKKLQRSHKSASQRNTRAIRKCLRCLEEFMSDGPGNRLCGCGGSDHSGFQDLTTFGAGDRITAGWRG